MKTETGPRRLSSTALATLCGAFSLSLAEVARTEEKSNDSLWQEIEAISMADHAKREIVPRAYRMMRLNQEALGRVLREAPMEFTEAARGEGAVMTLAMPNGKARRFRIEESPIMSPELAAKFPEIKTYRGQGIDDPTATVRFDVTPLGFHAQVLSAQETFYVDPYAKGDTQNYISYLKRDFRKDAGARCLAETAETAGEETAFERRPTAPQVVPPNGATRRTYRLALAATAEYTAAAGGTVPLAMARMATTMNRVNGIYERELALRMTLVANNDALIYTDPNTDPYTNNDFSAMMMQNQDNLNAVIGLPNYDIGHVFATSNGGAAPVRSTCKDMFKGRGVTGLPNPVGDPFDVDFVAHEMGHQHGGLHTFNTTTGVCAPPLRNAVSAYEPGSGSTPMSYVGTCAPNNLQPNAHDYFHVRTLEQMLTYMAGDGSCAAQSPTGNTPPTVSAGGNFTIPRNTPFTLTASASDANADSVTYAWEEYDLSAGISPPEGDADGVARPIFRSYPPTINPTRTFPSLQYILNNANVPPATYDCGLPSPCITGESLPNITRTMNFQVTARDNRAGGGGIVSAMMQVNVDAGAGPFVVTQPDTAVSWAGGSQKTVLWNVANTNAAPVNAANVNIRLSTDGGNTFPIFLAANTPNDGSQTITVPNFSTTMARIKVEAAANIFFDISGANFTISGSGPFPPPTTLANISTRLRVETGDNVLIGGFIVTGTQLKKVIVRAIGPSLALADKLANPTLELRNSAGGLIKANDDWKQSSPADKQAIIDSTIPPSNDLESAIVAMLPANNGYTAIVRGVNNTTGIGVVEVYDLDRSVDSKLANISTRGLVQTGDTILIAGTFVLGQTAQKVILRAIGPSLSIAGKLLDPTMELRDQNGALIRANDNWRIGGQEAEIIATTIPPSHDSESAIVAILPANGASYTAIVRGVGNTTGIAVVEMYALN